MKRRPARSLRRWLGRALLGVGALVVSLGVLEIGVRLFVPADVFTPFQPIYRRDAVASYTLRPNHECYAYGAELRTNEFGFRGPSWAATRPLGACRIALIGDSHAFGFGVAYSQSVGEVLARELNRRGRVRYEVLNFALPGYNSRNQLAVLEQYTMRFGPDLVLVLMCENDHAESSWVDQQGWLHGAHEPRDDPHRPPPMVVEKTFLQWSRLYMWAKLKWRQGELAREQSTTSGGKGEWMGKLENAPVSPELQGTVLEPLLGMARACRGRGVVMVLAALAARPDYRRLIAEFEATTLCASIELLKSFPEAHGWQELFAQFGLGWNNHLDAEGHRRWAVAIADLLEQRNLLPATGR